MLNLRATPIEVVATPGAGRMIYILGGHCFIDYTAAYTETADNLQLRYVNGTGTVCSGVIEATGFADATADSFSPIVALPTGSGVTSTAGEISNAAVVIHNTGDGEWGGGNAANTMIVTVYYVDVASNL